MKFTNIISISISKIQKLVKYMIYKFTALTFGC